MIETLIYGYGLSKVVEWGMTVVGIRQDVAPARRVEAIEGAPHPKVNPDAVSFVDHRGLRCFYPSYRLEILNALRGYRPFPVDALGNVVSIAPDPQGNPIPMGESAEAWARGRNESALILAPFYIQHNVGARRFLRACLRSHAHLYAAARGEKGVPLYAVLCEVGQAARIDTRSPPPSPVSKVDAPPTMVVPTLATAIANVPVEEASAEVVAHEHPMPPPANAQGPNGHDRAVAIGGAPTEEAMRPKRSRSRKRASSGGGDP